MVFYGVSTEARHWQILPPTVLSIFNFILAIPAVTQSILSSEFDARMQEMIFPGF